MKQPLNMQFIGMKASAAVEAAVREGAAKLDQFEACQAKRASLGKHHSE